jgi:predicted XRE-type DNA-binding protein
MNAAKKKRLETRGWKVSTTAEFLDLTPEEEAFVELRLKLADAVRRLRREKRLTQVEFARLLGSSQSRVAKLEAAENSVSLDLLIRSLLALGATTRDLAKVIGTPAVPRPNPRPAENAARARYG